MISSWVSPDFLWVFQGISEPCYIGDYHDTDKNQNKTYRQGLERNSQNGTCDLISSVNRSDIGGRGKMFPGPGS